MSVRRRSLVGSVLALLLACGGGPATADEISADALLERAAAGTAPLVLDVRSPEEYASGHVPGARNVAFDQVAARLDELGAPGEVVVYCESGRRAAKASSVLEEAGFQVLHLSGDMRGWREAGHPTEN